LFLAAGIPDTFTGQPKFNIAKPADNCWVMAQHQWANEGCTAVHDRNDTIGGPVNEAGGGGELLLFLSRNSATMYNSRLSPIIILVPLKTQSTLWNGILKTTTSSHGSFSATLYQKICNNLLILQVQRRQALELCPILIHGGCLMHISQSEILLGVRRITCECWVMNERHNVISTYLLFHYTLAIENLLAKICE